MTQRRETRTKTTTTQVRIEFTAAELRKRLRLPEDAVLTDANNNDDWPLVATFTRTSKSRPEGSA